MNYHLMVDEKFINDFITDAENAAPGNNMYIIDNWKTNARFVTSTLAVFTPFYTPAFYAILKKVTDKDKVFVHWASDQAIEAVLSLPSNITTGLFFWGGDVVEIPSSRFKKTIYGPLSLPYFEKNEERPKLKLNPLRPKRMITSFAQRFFNYKGADRKTTLTRELFFKRLNLFLHWGNLDFEWVRKHYTTGAVHEYFFYEFGTKISEEEQQLIEATKDTQTTTIMLGNSDTITNNHLEALQALSAYKDEPIKLVIPLSYGNKKYGNLIENEAIRIFGKDKIMALRSFLKRDEYYKLLAKVDVAVMFQFRLQAVGNVIALLYRRKKIFLHSHSTFYQFLKTNDVTIFDSKEIGKMDFKQFIAPTDQQTIEKNIINIDKLYNDEEKMKALTRILQ
ncbi:TDP-N-acetylfucosamine:lipid II N-acetylfucosaminyltransferase [Chitinophaga sp. G-6-1-13]|uniref:TDP-N-acetylfucosamine:lipid II N-acetylfucosaminyltransferase n=1 Tax=Chitinophaga fulva TaxID=2728842 RepID=A0A848GPG1_9BACT|nr:TDP-N-acetylfucosamine:lipid II N-acetylfucosaminyltransferase [Chitinophaga fulva]NML40386.1 TDP-N-acetylfucosamine:lipid II N-acetylfucosaminyltransferase [Chitinophaga fulva]